jgi:RNA polymerase sigma-70 factor (ECF subfamily)
VDTDRRREALERILTAGRATHPHLVVDEDRFLAHVTRHLPADPTGWPDALERLHGADLYLAFACAEQVPGALAAFEAACQAAIDGALRDQVTASFADDAKQLVRERLFLGGAEDPDDGDQPAAGAITTAAEPRILHYAGRGPLAAWVAVSARRTALSIRRGEVSRRARDAAAAAEDGLAAAVHPELSYLKHAYRSAFAAAFEAAFAAITDRERTLLRLHLISRLRLDQIAPMFHVNASTISRWLASARETLVTQTREGLAERLHVATGEVASVARLLQSQVDVSLARLLADDDPEKP